ALRTQQVRSAYQFLRYLLMSARKSLYPLENRRFFGFGLLYAKFHLRTALTVPAVACTATPRVAMSCTAGRNKGDNTVECLVRRDQPPPTGATGSPIPMCLVRQCEVFSGADQ